MPPMAEARVPTIVIPICTRERKFSGFSRIWKSALRPPLLPLLDHLLDLAFPGGDDGELSRREYPVQDDEDGDDRY